MEMQEITEHVPGLYSTHLNIDLDALKKSCMFLQDFVLKEFSNSENRKFQFCPDSRMLTDLYQEYNLLMYPFPEFHDLYFNVQHIFHQVLTHSLGKTNNQYYMQSWLNIYEKGQFIDWHDHWRPHQEAWHGFFCVDVEPNSKTSYMWPNMQEIIDIESKNNLLVIGTSNGDKHKSSSWENSYPRITIAFDIVPSKSLIFPLMRENQTKQELQSRTNILDIPDGVELFRNSKGYINHWLPI
jgi:hypothetical protein